MSAERGQKWNKASNADFTFESGIYQYIFGKKWTNHSALSKQESEHFELRDFALVWPFDECGKPLKSLVKYLSTRGY